MIQSSIKMEIIADPDYVSIIRLTASGIANKIGFDIDTIEDLKVAISEACTNAIKHSDDDKVVIEFKEIINGLEVEVKDSGKGYDVNSIVKPEPEELKENGLGVFIIQSLMDEVVISSNENEGTTIRMIKYLGADK